MTKNSSKNQNNAICQKIASYSEASIVKRFDPEKIKIIREAQQITQAELAKAAGISRDTLLRIEKGKKARTPKHHVLARIAKKLKVDMDEFFTIANVPSEDDEYSGIDVDKLTMPSFEEKQKHIIKLILSLEREQQIGIMAYLAGLLASSNPFAASLASEVAISLETSRKP